MSGRGSRDNALEWEREYGQCAPLYSELADEAVFALNRRLNDAGIAIHSLTRRVKSLTSLRDKVERKSYVDPLRDVEDIVGLRVVTLFLSDIPRVMDVLRNVFDILDSEDKIADDDSRFGYMSLHCTARIHGAHSGPRYDAIKELVFEVQVRTIVMDAWANISHHLAYKGQSSVPTELRKDFNALSGLFYVADQHFEMVARHASLSQERAKEEVGDERFPAVKEINLDTLQAYLEHKYDDRDHVRKRRDISEFVEELAAAGYHDLQELDRILSAAGEAFRQYEAADKPDAPNGWYADVGVARLSLAIADPEYAAAVYPTTLEEFDSYRVLVSDRDPEPE